MTARRTVAESLAQAAPVTHDPIRSHVAMTFGHVVLCLPVAVLVWAALGGGIVRFVVLVAMAAAMARAVWAVRANDLRTAAFNAACAERGRALAAEPDEPVAHRTPEPEPADG